MVVSVFLVKWEEKLLAEESKDEGRGIRDLRREISLK